MDDQQKKEIMAKIFRCRSNILKEHPFFGNLLMQMSIVLAPCNTAATDMKRIYFDPEFAGRLSETELEFVMLHEIMHCALKHCTRASMFDRNIFNIACDIVVNSNILNAMGLKSILVDGCAAIHLVPNHGEGYLFSAEEVYDILIVTKGGVSAPLIGESCRQGQSGGEGKALDEQEQPDEDSLGCIDNHEPWNDVENSELLEKEFDRKIKIAKSFAESSSIGSANPFIRELLKDKESKKIDWREALADFIQRTGSLYDYTFIPPDRRFLYLDVALPAFNEIFEEENIADIWFCIDVSGSIGDDCFSMIFNEIKNVFSQFVTFSGKLSFFSTIITEPVDFESIEELNEIENSFSTGGTDFKIIFDYLKKELFKLMPKAIIILTDGYAWYPPEEMAMGIPVLWIIVRGKGEDTQSFMPPWGEVISIVM